MTKCFLRGLNSLAGFSSDRSIIDSNRSMARPAHAHAIFGHLSRVSRGCGFDHQTINLQLLTVILLGNPSQKCFKMFRVLLERCRIAWGAICFNKSVKLPTESTASFVKRTDMIRFASTFELASSLLCCSRFSPRSGSFYNRSETPRHNSGPGTEQRARSALVIATEQRRIFENAHQLLITLARLRNFARVMPLHAKDPAGLLEPLTAISLSRCQG